MKIFLAAVLYLFFGLSAFAQITATAENEPVKVESIVLMRDDGAGDPGAETESFKTSDKPIHFQIILDSITPAAVKLILSAKDVKGLKTGTKIFAVNYKTDGEQNIVYFRGSPKTVWLAGSYQVDVYIDDKLAAGKKFEIEKSNSTPAEQTNFSPQKPKAKPKKLN